MIRYLHLGTNVEDGSMKVDEERVPILKSGATAEDPDLQDSGRQGPYNIFRLSKVFLVLFFVGTIAVLAIGAGIGVANYNDHIVVTNSGSGKSIEDFKPSSPSAFERYRFAAVAADAPECSTIGTEILAEGGSAVDAAISSLLCVGLLNAHSSGIGGGSFMMIYDRSHADLKKKAVALDFRETSPEYLTTDFYKGDAQLKKDGPHSIGVPGEIRGYHEAWQKYGKLPWARLFRPIIRMCKRGYVVRSGTASAVNEKWDRLKDSESWRELYLNDVGRLYKEGEYMTNPRLADTLTTIADDPDSFYTGALAEEIIKDLQDGGSQITAEELRDYKPEWKEPMVTNLSSMGFTSYTMPSPSSGPIYHFMLKLIETYNLHASDIRYRDKAIQTYHRIAEIFKFGFAERTFLGDADFVNITEKLQKWNSEAYINEIRSQIDDKVTHNVSYYHPAAQVTLDGGTCHLSILAPDGSAVSATSTINAHFGSLIRGSRTGIIFNNEQDDFSLPGPPDSYGLLPNAANFPQPGKRPLSSMVPTIMVESGSDQVRLVIGASGSQRILTGTTYVTAHNLWLGARIDHAVDMPRLHHSLSPNILEHEKGFSKIVSRGLSAKGHDVQEKSSTSICQAIRSYCGPCDTPVCRNTCIQAVSDHRKGGVPDGY